MSARGKSIGWSDKFGKQEKTVLLLLIEHDEPAGKAHYVWVYIYSEFNINYGRFAKKKDVESFKLENKFKRALYRLTQRDLVRPLNVYGVECSWFDLYVTGYQRYVLTEEGRLIAEKLQHQKRLQKLFLKDKEYLEKALGVLRGLGCDKVVAGQVRDVLWQLLSQNFFSRAEFDAHWTNTRLGSLLRSYVAGRSHVATKDGRRLYYLGDE